mmetsp:Transcript_42143/g.130175  ORF Transcript_42143/g.130175 Transcript_42143/m.130175 type:complete len:274 (-) Transcript_42143:55-876(-)
MPTVCAAMSAASAIAPSSAVLNGDAPAQPMSWRTPTHSRDVEAYFFRMGTSSVERFVASSAWCSGSLPQLLLASLLTITLTAIPVVSTVPAVVLATRTRCGATPKRADFTSEPIKNGAISSSCSSHRSHKTPTAAFACTVTNSSRLYRDAETRSSAFGGPGGPPPRGPRRADSGLGERREPAVGGGLLSRAETVSPNRFWTLKEAPAPISLESRGVWGAARLEAMKRCSNLLENMGPSPFPEERCCGFVARRCASASLLRRRCSSSCAEKNRT